MATFFDSLLRQIAGWGKRSAERNGHRRLPENVEAHLRREFRLLPTDTVDLRCVKRGGLFSVYAVQYVRIFDRAKAHEQGVVIKGYSDLDKYPELMLFEGHIFDCGMVHLTKKKVSSA